MNPEGWVFLYCIQSEVLVSNCFLAHYFLGYNKHSVCLYECLPLPSETVYSEHTDMSPIRMECITYIVPCIPQHIVTGYIYWSVTGQYSPLYEVIQH